MILGLAGRYGGNIGKGPKPDREPRERRCPKCRYLLPCRCPEVR